MIAFTKEQIYIVTGASSGIGRECALMLNHLGASVIAIARDEARLQDLYNNAINPHTLFIEKKDLAQDIAQLPQYIKTLRENYGKLSGAIYSAGVTGTYPLQLLDYEIMKYVFDINYYVPVFMTKGLVDKRNNIGRDTSIVAISSSASLISDKAHALYSSTKSALSVAMRSFAHEVAKYHIRINCLLPSIIDTPMTEDKKGIIGYKERHIAKYPFGFGEPRDVASFAMFLLSSESKFISGQNYIVDSGGVL